MKTLLTLLTLALTFIVNAQDPTIEWQNTIGGSEADNLHSIQQTIDGGYILGGESLSGISGDKTEASQGNEDYWVIKLDVAGNIIWQNTIGGSSRDWLYQLQQTADGGYILGGLSNSTISGDKTEATQGSYDYWVIKLDTSGNIVWQNTIGGNGGDELRSIQQTTDGGYILGGNSNSGIFGDKTEASQGNSDYWVIKLDIAGNIVWQNTIGGNLLDNLYSIQQTTDGGYILGGYTLSGISGDKAEASQGNVDYWVIKLDTAGNIVWQNTIGGDYIDHFRSIQETADGGYILGGHSNSGISGDKTEASKGGVDWWVLKLDAAGNIVWQKTIGGDESDIFHSIQQTADGGYIVSGFSSSGISGDKTEASQGGSDYWVIKLNAAGNIQWQNTIGGIDYDALQSVQQTADGGYIVGGFSSSGISGDKTEASSGGDDYWVVKLNRCAAYTPVINNISCVGLCDGLVSLPGYPGSSYSWSTGDTVRMIQSLCPGTYQYTATDTAGTCTGFAEVLEPDTLRILPEIRDSCGSGAFPQSVNLNVSGGTPRYSYTFSSGNLVGGYWIIDSAGTHSVTVTDSRGCTDTSSVIVYNFSASISSIPPSCGQSDGTVSITISAGSGNYIYQWAPVSSSDSFLTGLPSGVYYVTVTDGSYCMADSVTLFASCGTINGHVFNDINGNGLKETGEAGRAGVTVRINPGGLTAITNQGGDYFISVGVYDTFTVQVLPPSRYYCSGTSYLPDSISSPAANLYTLNITSADSVSSGNDFGLAQPQLPCGTISGSVFDDLNGNGMNDGEPPKSGVIVELSNGQGAVTDFFGNYSVEVPHNVPLAVSVQPSPGSYFCGAGQPYYNQTFPPFNGTYNITLNSGLPSSTGNDFGVKQSSSDYDVGIYSIRSFAGVIGGRIFRGWMDFKANGSNTDTCKVRLAFDPLVTFVSADLTPDVVTSSYIEWVFPPGTAPSWYCVEMAFTLNRNAIAGNTLTWTGTYLCGSPDGCPGNDSLTVTTMVESGPLRRMQVNGFNAMEVEHTGNASGIITTSDSVFSYIINFQNTGTDTVYHLTIVDTLSPHLNIETISYPFSSKGFKLSIPAPNILIWEFNILLPDSATDFLNSYGFIQYNIHMKPNLPSGTVIENRGALSFNYNEPYLTNQTRLEIEELIISGNIVTEMGLPVTSAKVDLTGSNSSTVYTPIDGSYIFNIPSGDYTVSPSKSNDANPANGISSLDILLIRRHILQIVSLNSPYKIIAADVDASSTITTSDIVQMRSLILANTSTYLGGRLWTFVNSDFVFADPLTPFPFENSRSFTNVTSSQTNQNFIGIKLGDVNNSWNPNVAKVAAVGSLQLALDEYTVMPGNEIIVSLKVKDFKNITGYQFTLSWNPQVLALLEVNNQSLTGYYGMQKTSEGYLTTTWYDDDTKDITLDDDETAFELRFKVIGAIGTQSEIKIGSELTASEAYNENLDLLNIVATNGMVKVGDATSVVSQQTSDISLTVQPNPFSNTTNIIFTLPQDETVTLSIYDILGREVKQITADYKAGEHQVEWSGDDANGNKLSQGLYHIRMMAGEAALSRKAVMR